MGVSEGGAWGHRAVGDKVVEGTRTQRAWEQGHRCVSVGAVGTWGCQDWGVGDMAVGDIGASEEWGTWVCWVTRCQGQRGVRDGDKQVSGLEEWEHGGHWCWRHEGTERTGTGT